MVLLAAVRVSYGAPPQESVAAQGHAERARQSLGRGQLKIAETELRQAVELAPQEGEYLGLLGIVLGMQQKLQESDTYLEKALRLNPGDSATRRNLAWNQFQLGQLEPAKTNLERVMKEKPRDNAATLVLGMVHEELRDYRRALTLLESVPDQVRERPESMAALARSYYYTGRAQKAHEALNELQLRPAKPEEMFLAGQVAAELHDFETAASLFQSIPATYPRPQSSATTWRSPSIERSDFRRAWRRCTV
jgi:tetratricopeptide (TPR) repeat protein